jgi:hypothetical protein
MPVVPGFKARHGGRCATCRQPYDAGTEITSATPAHIVPPQFSHHPACPPRPVFTDLGSPDPDPAAHRPAQIGRYDADGHRTFAPPGEVCVGCSNPTGGRWVPVSDCPIALAKWQVEHDSHGGAAETLS